MQKRPVGEEPGLSPDQLRQPSPSTARTLLEPLELASHPPEDVRIELLRLRAYVDDRNLHSGAGASGAHRA